MKHSVGLCRIICLSFFHLQILITPLVSSNLSSLYLCFVIDLTCFHDFPVCFWNRSETMCCCLFFILSHQNKVDLKDNNDINDGVMFILFFILVQAHKTSLALPLFLLRCLYQARKVSGFVFVRFCLFLLFFVWILELFQQYGIFRFSCYPHITDIYIYIYVCNVWITKNTILQDRTVQISKRKKKPL